jgi:DNA-binding Lrp family transcriptional regulator
MDIEHSKPRAVARAFGEMVLQWMQLIARPFGGEFEPAVLLVAIQQANLPPGWEGPPRPISTAAVAQSLGFSRETTRRYVMALEAKGLVERSAEGLIAPRHQDGPPFAARRELYDIVLRFIRHLRAAGVDWAQEQEPDLPPPGPDPGARERVLLVGRTFDRFILRWVESAIRDFDGELRLMLAHTAVILANERALLAEPRLNALYGGLIPPPESLRRAATISVLAQLAGLSRETTRRFVGQLEARGFVGRTAGGVLARMEGEHMAFCVRRVLDLYPNIRQFVLILRGGGAAFLEEEAQSVA